MDENLKILENWYEGIKAYECIKLNKAKDLYIKMNETTDLKEKEKIRETLITGTLYLIYNLIKNSGLLYINSKDYDTDDIINACCETWIKRIDNGCFLESKYYTNTLNVSFIDDVSKNLISNSTSYYKQVGCNILEFENLLNWYLSQKQGGNEISYKEFIEFINKKNIVSKNIDYGRIYVMFEEIFSSLSKNNHDESIKLTPRKIRLLLKLFIDGSLDYALNDCNGLYVDDFAPEIDYTIFSKQVCSNAFEILTGLEALKMQMYYGFDNSTYENQRDIGIALKTTRAAVSDTIIKSLTKTRGKRELLQQINTLFNE